MRKLNLLKRLDGKKLRKSTFFQIALQLMTRPIPASEYVKNFNPNLRHHCDWLLSVLERLVSHEPEALQEGQPLKVIWESPEGQEAHQSPAAALAALPLIKEFEGCRLVAYLCPAGIWTIGWGNTAINKVAVKQGDKITQKQADEMLEAEVVNTYEQIVKLIPAIEKWPPNKGAALISWAYNVGIGAVKDSTLRERLLDGENANAVIQEELPRWAKAGAVTLPGLVRRRAAEVEMFVGKQLQQSVSPKKEIDYGNPLQVPWYSQMDSDTSQGRRMCFSSSCAMLLEYLKPGTLKGRNGDDQYLKAVQKFGDTTDPTAQIKALESYGITASFSKKADFVLIENQIKAGIPVPCGYLHRGPVSSPAGGGHWLIVVGYDANNVIVHDPFGEADLVLGTTIGSAARFMKYSRKNFGKRWMVDGDKSGWAVIAQR